nr:conjugal transfer protein TrbL family protein [Pelotomaculum terephthalicicum]
MFIWDFTTGLVLGQIMDWIYGQIIGFLGEFFAMMGNMGAELFDMSWVQAIVLFFSYLAWALYGTGVVVQQHEIGMPGAHAQRHIRQPLRTVRIQVCK